jgi:hypothetical protein
MRDRGSMITPATYFCQRKKGANSSPIYIIGKDIEKMNTIFQKAFPKGKAFFYTTGMYYFIFLEIISMKHYISAESVTAGHPDKMCDQISDAILDACLTEDPNSRVACECMTTTGTVIVSGEITTNAWVNFQDIARKVVRDIGYDSLEA